MGENTRPLWNKPWGSNPFCVHEFTLSSLLPAFLQARLTCFNGWKKVFSIRFLKTRQKLGYREVNLRAWIIFEHLAFLKFFIYVKRIFHLIFQIELESLKRPKLSNELNTKIETAGGFFSRSASAIYALFYKRKLRVPSGYTVLLLM